MIAHIRRQAARKAAVALGIGDDCAVIRLPSGHEALVTTDFSLEGVHFRREFHPPESIGHRCLARGLSDIAAMGGEPVAAFLSLALPRKLPQSWADRFMKGFLNLADQFHVSLAGGDTAESSAGVLADIVVLGSVPKNTAIRRSRARPGDRIYVTGELGASAAALHFLISGRKLRPFDFPRHFFPLPRIVIGRFLREKKLASAMIDLSDGLSTDLGHICEESGVAAEIRAAALPIAKVGSPARQVDLKVALHGGEDYELLFTSPRNRLVPRKIAGVRVTEIGQITRGKLLSLINQNGVPIQLRPQGWQHFKRRPGSE